MWFYFSPIFSLPLEIKNIFRLAWLFTEVKELHLEYSILKETSKHKIIDRYQCSSATNKMGAKFIWQLVQEGRTDSDNKSPNKSECQLWQKYFVTGIFCYRGRNNLSQRQKYFVTDAEIFCHRGLNILLQRQEEILCYRGRNILSQRQNYETKSGWIGL